MNKEKILIALNNISEGFDWTYTPQGKDYWLHVHRNLIDLYREKAPAPSTPMVVDSDRLKKLEEDLKVLRAEVDSLKSEKTKPIETEKEIIRKLYREYSNWMTHFEESINWHNKQSFVEFICQKYPDMIKRMIEAKDLEKLKLIKSTSRGFNLLCDLIHRSFP